MADGTDRSRPDQAATAPAGGTGLPSIDGYPYDVPPELLSMADATVLGMHALLDGAPVALVTHAYRHGEAKLTAAYVQLADVLSDLQAAVGREFTNAPSAAVEAVRRIAVAEAERDRVRAAAQELVAAVGAWFGPPAGVGPVRAAAQRTREALAALGTDSPYEQDEPDGVDLGCQWIEASGIPIPGNEVRAWLDRLNVPTPVGVHSLMAEIRRAVIAAGDAGHAAGYAEAVAYLRDDARYTHWWSSTRVKPGGPSRRHLADYLETVGPYGPDVTLPPRSAAEVQPDSGGAT